MAISTPPGNLDEKKANALLRAYLFYFSEENPAKASVYQNTSFTDKEANIYYSKVTDFVDDLNQNYGIPVKTSAKNIGITLQSWFEAVSKNTAETTTEIPQYMETMTESPDARTASKNEPLSQMVEEMEKKEAQRKEVIAKSDKEIREAIERKQAIAAEQRRIREEIAKTEELKAKAEKIYVKVEEVKTETKLAQKEAEAFEKLKKEADPQTGNPREVAKGVASEIISRAGKNIPEEVVNTVSSQAAVDAVNSFSPITLANPVIKTAVLTQIATHPDINQGLKSVASKLSDSQIPAYKLSRELLDSAFKGIGGEVFNEAKYKVQVSATPQAGFVELPASQIFDEHISNLQNQDSFLGEIGDMGVDEIKGAGMSRINRLLQVRINALPANHFLRSEFAKDTMAVFGVGAPVTWQYTGSSAIMKFAGSSGFAPALGWVQGRFGINLGFQKVATEAGKQLAVKAGTTGLAAKAVTALGAAATPVSAGISLAISAAISKFISWIGPKIKKFVSENKEALFGIGALGMIFGGGALRLISVAPLVAGGAALLGGGFSGGAFASSIVDFFGSIGRLLVVTIGTPVLITLLVFPVVVTLILFIINSGAYIVPPSPLSTSGAVVSSAYIEVVKTANPTGPFENSDLPLTIEYTIQIKAKKSQLSNVSINYSCKVVKESSSPVCPPTEGEIPTTVDNGVSPASPFTFTYKQTYNKGFEDSFVTDTISVEADAGEALGEEAAGSATIKIGKPPEECPSSWPTGHGYITQGAYTGSGNSHAAMEAIDIGVSHTGVLAGHSGTVITAQRDSCLGNYIQIRSSCNGKEFMSQYAHLEGLGVKVGQNVTMGQNIGLSGNTGRCTSGPHLHYRFKYVPDGNPSWPKNPPFMMSPYIPQDVPRGCKNSTSCNLSF